MRRRVSVMVMLAAMVCSSGVAIAKTRLAVLDLQSKNAPKELTLAVSDLLRVELIKSGAYDVVDRENMNLILKEQAFQQTGCTSAECAVEVGQILNCQKMFVGSLAKIGNRYFMIIQRVDVQTARVDYANSLEANQEEALPETVAELARQAIKGKVDRGKRVKAGDVRGGRRISLELGGMVMPNFSFVHWLDRATNVSWSKNMIAGIFGCRYYPSAVNWLGLGVVAMPVGTNISPGREVDEHRMMSISTAGGEVRKQAGLGSSGFSIYGAEVFLDMTGATRWARRRVQLVLGAGYVIFSTEEQIQYNYAIPPATEITQTTIVRELSSKVPYYMLAVDVRYRIAELMLGMMGLSDDVIFWEAHATPFEHPLFNEISRETGLTSQAAGSVFLSLRLLI